MTNTSTAIPAPRPGGRRRISRAATYVIASVAAAIALGPFIWMVLTSFKSTSESFVFPPTILPAQPTTQSYEELFAGTAYLQFLANSMIVAVAVTAIVCVLATCASYVLVRFSFRGLEWMARLTVLSYTMPAILLVVPVVRIFVWAGLVDSLFGLVLVYSALYLPLGIWLLRGYFIGLPADPEESAMIDGCTRFQAFYRMAVPQAVPGIVTVAVFTFNASWNEYLYASVMLQSPTTKTLSAGLASFIGEVSLYSWPMLMAAGVITSLPVVLVFLFLQRYLVSGLSAGAVKG
jgi:ABC-type glycerol-3-phosphate transport system permease component